jgi:hypothetical protein
LESERRREGGWSGYDRLRMSEEEIGNIISSMTIIYNFAEKVINTPETENIKSNGDGT